MHCPFWRPHKYCNRKLHRNTNHIGTIHYWSILSIQSKSFFYLFYQDIFTPPLHYSMTQHVLSTNCEIRQCSLHMGVLQNDFRLHPNKVYMRCSHVPTFKYENQLKLYMHTRIHTESWSHFTAHDQSCQCVLLIKLELGEVHKLPLAEITSIFYKFC